MFVCVHGVWRATCLAFSLSKSPCNPNKYKHKHTQRHTHIQGNGAGTLTEMEQNRPFSREQNHRGEEPRGADWYSLQLIFAESKTHNAAALAARTATREGEAEREPRRADPVSPPPPPPSPLICKPTAACKAPLCSHNCPSEAFRPIKERRGSCHHEPPE